MTYEEAKIWIDLAQFAATAGVGLYVHMVNKHDRTNGRISKLEGEVDRRLDDHGNRLAKLEGAIQHLPTHSDMTGLKTDVAGLKKETEGQTALLERLTTQVDRINEWLIDRAK